MKNLKRTLVVATSVCAVLLSGCASLPKTELDSANRQRLKSIALLQVTEPAGESVVNLGGAAAGFGLIGGLVQAGINTSHTNTYTKQIADKQVLFAPVVVDGITQKLSASGYVVVDLHDQKPKVASDGKSDDYSAIQTDADGILNVWFTSFGYVSPPETGDFIPWVVVRARLVDAKTKQDMYFKTFACGWDIKGNSVHVISEPTYRYGSFDALTSAADQSVQGIKDCETSIVGTIMQDFERVH